MLSKVVKALIRLSNPHCDELNPVRVDSSKKFLVCIDPRAKKRVISYRETGRSAYPNIFLCAVPTNERFVVFEFVKAVVVPHLDAVPLKLCPHHQETLAPLHDRALDARVDRLFVNKLHGEKLRWDFLSLYHVENEMRKHKRILATGERQINRHSVGENVANPGPCRRYNVHGCLLPFYSHIFSPHFGQMTNLLVSNSPTGDSSCSVSGPGTLPRLPIQAPGVSSRRSPGNSSVASSAAPAAWIRDSFRSAARLSVSMDSLSSLPYSITRSVTSSVSPSMPRSTSMS